MEGIVLMEQVLAEINRNLKEIVVSQNATQIDVAKIGTRLDLIDERGTAKSISSIGELHEKINGVKDSQDKKIIGGLAASVLALLGVIGALIKDGLGGG